MFPPMLLYLRVGKPERPGIGLWLPLFLVWLILLPLVVLVLVITVLVDLALLLSETEYHRYTMLLLRTLGVLGALRDLSFSVRTDESVLEIALV